MIERVPDLELFTRIVEAGSLSGAARSLGMTQPTVSKRLAAMERELSVRLLQRSTHRLQLTDEGQAWYEACRKWVGELHTVSLALQGKSAGAQGVVRVNAPLVLGRHVLVPLILRFLEEQPTVTIELTLNDRRVDLVADRVDVAVRIGKVGNPEVVARRLVSYRTRLVASPGYLAEHGAPATVDELRGRPVLFYGTPQGEVVEGPGGKVRVLPNTRFLTNDASAFVAAVEAGLGLGLSSHWLFAPALAAGTLVPVLPEAFGERLPVHAVFLPSRALPARVRTFVAFLQREVPRAVAGMPGVSR